MPHNTIVLYHSVKIVASTASFATSVPSSTEIQQRGSYHVEEACREGCRGNRESKGIGAAIAKHLADEGAAEVVNYATSKQGSERVVAEIARNGGKALAVQGNVSKRADIERLFAETRRAFGRLDTLVNNAGIYEFSPIEDATEGHFHVHAGVDPPVTRSGAASSEDGWKAPVDS